MSAGTTEMTGTPPTGAAGTGSGAGGRGKEPHLARELGNRHIQMIAIGGAIGTGLFMGSGKTISLAGPAVLFVYMIIGFMLFFVMRAMGEILLSNLQYKSFGDFAGDILYAGWTDDGQILAAGLNTEGSIWRFQPIQRSSDSRR